MISSHPIQCRQCSKTFRIEAADFEFYQRLQVPAPTHCPDCRLQRRLVWRNERTLYERTCDLCTKPMIAIYPAQTPFPVYCQNCWWGSNWDPKQYGRAIDFTRPFFEQYKQLLQDVPRVSLVGSNNENSPYISYTNYSANCYMVIGGHHDERCLYTWRAMESRDCVDSIQINKCELCYYSSDLTNCYNIHFSSQVSGSHDGAYLFDVKGSNNCFLSGNLRNAQYIFKNKQLTAPEYERAIAQYPLQSYAAQQTAWTEYEHLLIGQTIHRATQATSAVNSTGNNLVNVSNCNFAFNVQNSENSTYVNYCEAIKDAYDCTFSGWPAELLYENLSAGVHSYNVMFGVVCWSCRDTSYSENCHNSHDLFGCSGLRKAEFSILNKTYDAVTYAQLKEKLIQYMRETGEYGQFFPTTLSPHAYNETLANTMFPMTAEQVQQRGWRWLQEDSKSKRSATAAMSVDLSFDAVTLVQQTFSCSSCTRSFRLTSAEVAFHQQTKIALSPLCSSCRFKQLMALRTPLAIWQRRCMCTQTDHGHHGLCPTEFPTSYAPDRKELVYCEACYNKEIY